MDPATAIRTARERAHLSKRELARRAGTSAAAIVLYESGAREPSYGTLTRIVRATGFDTRLSLSPTRLPDRAVLGRRLQEVLELADQLPHRKASRHLTFPALGALVRR